MFNAVTTAAIYRAVYTGMPVTHRVVTVSGSGVNEPKNLECPIGAPIHELLDACGGVKKSTFKILMGGPMMGHAQYDMDAPIGKGTNAILAFCEDEERTVEHPACIRCGKCVSVCPMRLQPVFMYQYEQAGMLQELEAAHVMDCMECGACTYICPGRLHLVQAFRAGKQRINNAKAAAKAAAEKAARTAEARREREHGLQGTASDRLVLPHIRTKDGTSHIMAEVLIALLPALAFSVYNFGWYVLTVTAVSAAGCCFFEWLYRAVMRKNNTVGDLSAAVTGVLIAFVLPSQHPLWIVLIGDFFAIVIVKQLFGGIGKNFLNPALAARAFMFSWAGAMSTWRSPAPSCLCWAGWTWSPPPPPWPISTRTTSRASWRRMTCRICWWASSAAPWGRSAPCCCSWEACG